jgi:DNA modification methylase
MIPARVAIALQADGWYLRSDIIWHKPNPMPESVTDRPTSAHEHVFLLTKRDRYFYDAGAIAEEATAYEHGQRYGNTPSLGAAIIPNRNDSRPRMQGGIAPGRETRNARNVWTIATQPNSLAHFAMMPAELAERCIKAGSKPGDTILDPFAGAGTTLLVADRLQRHGVGIELNPANGDLARNRVRDDAPLFAELVA